MIFQRLNNIVTRALPLKSVKSRLAAPVASITFDDFPKTAWTVGGPILERHNARATYYTAGRFQGLTEDGIEYYDAADLAAVRAAGHEVGCHSFAHDPAPSLATKGLDADLARNADFLGGHMASYAYPYGAISPRAKAVMGRRFANARGVRSGVNAGWIDLAQLNAIPIEFRRWRPGEIDDAIELAQATNGWIVFFTHDVTEAPSPFGCTPGMLDHVLGALGKAGIEILPMKHAMARAVFGHAA